MTGFAARRPALLAALLGLGAFVPLIVFSSSVARLYWFGDDFALLSDFDRQGFWFWVSQPFAENYIPLSKALWVGAVLGTGGSYFATTCLIWTTHALNAALLAWALRRTGFSLFATVFATLAFGLSASTIEDLTWTTQWTTILVSTFFLPALCLDAAHGDAGWRVRLAKMLLCAGSALCFSRGVVSGCALGLVALMPHSDAPARLRSRIAPAVLYFLPSILTALAIAAFAPGHHLAEMRNPAHLLQAGRFALRYLDACPIVPWIYIGKLNWGIVPLTAAQEIGYGTLKLVLLALGWAFASARQRRLLAALLLADLGTAALLGFGRAVNSDPMYALSSRYQYGSLLATLPFVASAIAGLLERARLPRGGPTLLAAGALAAMAYGSLRGWQGVLPGWTEFRGTAGRQVIGSESYPPDGRDLPGAGFITNADARRLAQKYDLH